MENCQAQISTWENTRLDNHDILSLVPLRRDFPPGSGDGLIFLSKADTQQVHHMSPLGSRRLVRLRLEDNSAIVDGRLQGDAAPLCA